MRSQDSRPRTGAGRNLLHPRAGRMWENRVIAAGRPRPAGGARTSAAFCKTRLTNQEVKSLLESIERKRSAFEAALDDELKNSTIKGAGGQVNANEFFSWQPPLVSTRTWRPFEPPTRQRAGWKHDPHACAPSDGDSERRHHEDQREGAPHRAGEKAEGRRGGRGAVESRDGLSGHRSALTRSGFR